jgi:hypothetical protein
MIHGSRSDRARAHGLRSIPIQMHVHGRQEQALKNKNSSMLSNLAPNAHRSRDWIGVGPCTGASTAL